MSVITRSARASTASGENGSACWATRSCSVVGELIVGSLYAGRQPAKGLPHAFAELGAELAGLRPFDLAEPLVEVRQVAEAALERDRCDRVVGLRQAPTGPGDPELVH